ncbi:MAG: cell division protein FtsA [bacterium]
MKRPFITTAIDIGTSKITTVITTQDEDSKSLRVVGVSSVVSRGVRKSQVVDIDDVIEAATESVEMAERMAGFSVKDAVVSVSGIHIESQNSKGLVAVQDAGGEISESDVARVVDAAKAIPLPNAREIIHVIPRFFLVDNQDGIKDPVGMSGVRLESEAHLVTGSSVNIKNITKVMSEIGVDTKNLVFAGVASAEAVLTDTEKELGVVLVDIGGGTTSITVYVEGALSYSGVIPVGAKNITNDIAIGLRVGLDSAEAIKRALPPDEHTIKALDPKNLNAKKAADEIDLTKFGIKDGPKKISRKAVCEGIVRPRLNELFELVKKELIKAGVGSKTPAGLVLTGGGALTYSISDSARKVLNMQSRIGSPIGLSGLVDEIKTPEFATVTGLIMLSNKNTNNNSAVSSMPKLNLSFNFGNFGQKLADLFKSFLP